MTPVPEVPGVEISPALLTEEEELELKIKARKQEALEATRRMLKLCLDAKEAGSRMPKGAKSLVILDGQGEKLEHFEKGMKFIHEDMSEAESAIDDMVNPCWGLCLTCSKERPRETDIKYFSKPDKIVYESSEDENEYVSDGNDFIPLCGDEDKEEVEMRRNMEAVLSCIGNLRNMTIDMNHEITRQNDYANRIKKKMELQQMRIEAGNEKIFELQGSPNWEYAECSDWDDEQESTLK